MHRLGLFLTAALALIACASETDGNDRKTSGNGGNDGGGATTTAGGAGGCTEHWDCAEDQICIATQCNLAWGRQFCFSAMSADVAGTNPATGEAWDPLGGAPDLYVDGVINEMPPPLHTTAYVDDSFTPSWPDEVCLIFDQPGDTITLLVSDYDDVSANEYTGVGAQGTEVQWLAVLHDSMQQGTLVTTAEAGTFSADIAAK
jgi:hypothetical protein